MIARLTLRFIAIGYIALLLLLPVGFIVYRTFDHGLSPAVDALTTPDALHALRLTLLIAVIAVPLNTVFGVLCALMLVRHRFPGKSLLSAFIDLPLGVSPVVVGLALVALYGRLTPLGSWLADHDIQIIYALPSMVLATIFVSLPFVVREVVPVLQEIGTDAEQAAATLGASPVQTFFRITLPSIRAGVGYGVVLTTARALGEFGAVSVVSGKLIGRTETLTLFVEDRFQSFDATGAYAGSLALALLALMTLCAMTLFRPSEHA